MIRIDLCKSSVVSIRTRSANSPEYPELDDDPDEYGSYHLVDGLVTISQDIGTKIASLRGDVGGIDASTPENHIETIEDGLQDMLTIVEELKERKASTDDETFGPGDVRYELRSVGYGLDDEHRAELEDRVEHHNPKRSEALVCLHFDEIVDGDIDESIGDSLIYDEDAHELFDTFAEMCKHGLEDSLDALVDAREERDDEDTAIEECDDG